MYWEYPPLTAEILGNIKEYRALMLVRSSCDRGGFHVVVSELLPLRSRDSSVAAEGIRKFGGHFSSR